MDPRRKNQLLFALRCAALGALGLVLLPLTLPVVLGLGGACLLEPLVGRVGEKTGLTRGPASALTVSGVLLGLGLGLYGLGRVLLHEAVALSRRLPEILTAVGRLLDALRLGLEQLAGHLPDGAGDAFRAWAQQLTSGHGALLGGLYDRIFSLVSGFLSALPGSLLFLTTAVLSLYFSGAELPELKALFRRHLPRTLHPTISRTGGCLRAALVGWLRAQLRLMGVTCLVLTAGFWLLGVESPLLLGMGVALLDALPVLGTGTVLLPWALVAGTEGYLGMGLGLLGLYLLCALLRSILEPRLLGAQLGLSPLLTLVAIYAGWRLWGVAGMLLLPIGAVVAAELWQSIRAPAVSGRENAGIPAKNPGK